MNINRLAQLLVSGLLVLLTACQAAEQPLRKSTITLGGHTSSPDVIVTAQQTFCQDGMAWSTEVITDDVVDHATFWIALDAATIQDDFQYINVEVTLDGNSVAEEMKFQQAAEPYSVTCTESGQQFEAIRVKYTLLLPPLSSGQHSIAWKYTVLSDLDDSAFIYPRELTAEHEFTVE